MFPWQHLAYQLSIHTLTQLQQKLTLLIQNNPLGFIQWDAEFQVVEWNPMAETIFGYTRAEAIAQPSGQFIVPEEVRPQIQKIMNTLLQQQGGTRSINHNIRKDGQIILCEWFNTPLVSSQGDVIGIISMVQDITERDRQERARHAAEQALAQAHRDLEVQVDQLLEQKEIQYRSVFEAVNDCLFISSLETSLIVEVNAAACQVHGYTRDELIGMHPAQIIHEDCYPQFHQYMAAIQAGNTYQTQAMGVRKDGSLLEITVTGIPFLYGGEPHALGVIRDITDQQAALRERQQTETALRQQAQSLEQALATLQRTQAQLIQTEKMSSLGQLVAGIAHEINNPVSFIHGNLMPASEYTADLLHLLTLYQTYYPDPVTPIQSELSAIDIEFLKADLPKLIHSMSNGTRRIRDIVLSLRNFSRLDESDLKAIDIHEGLDSSLLILQHRLKDKSIQVGGQKYFRPAIRVIKNYSELPDIECYAGQLNQVFLNILTNAIDALDWRDLNRSEAEIRQNPSTITIVTQLLSADTLQLCIVDNGPGMSEDDRARVFDPFFTTKPLGQGTGLGLTTAYQIITDRHGGRISCHSHLAQGTTFVIELPLQRRG